MYVAINHRKDTINNKLDIVSICDMIPEKKDTILGKSDLQNNNKINKYINDNELVKKT